MLEICLNCGLAQFQVPPRESSMLAKGDADEPFADKHSS